MADEKEKETPAEDEESESGDASEESEEGSTDETSEESEGAESDDDDSSSSKKSDQTDWKKVADDERKRGDKAEKALSEDRYKKSERKRQDEDTEDEDEEDKALTKTELLEVLAGERKANRKEFRSSRIAEIAKAITDSEDEAQAVIEIHGNRSWPSDHTLEQEMDEAYFIAHGPRLKAKRDELRRSLKSKATKGESSAEDTHPDKHTKVKEPKLDTDVKKVLLDQGYKLVKGRFEKKLPNGKTMYYDLDTKKPIVEG